MESEGLVEQLWSEGGRNGGQGAYAWKARELCKKAAGEIERLRADITRQMEIATEAVNDRERLQARVAELEAGLGRCADIVRRNLYRQHEKIEDVQYIAAQLLNKETASCPK